MNSSQVRNTLLVCAIIGLLFYFLFSYRAPLRYYDLSGLSDLLRRDFSDVQIKDAAFEYENGGTHICLFLKENSDRDVRRPNIIRLPGKVELFTDFIPPGDIRILERYAVEPEKIIGFDESYAEVKTRFSEVSFNVRWYQIEDTIENDYNAVLISYIPRKIIIK